jgi:hypothetical protein
MQSAILVPFVALAVIGGIAARKQPRALWFLLAYLVVPVALAYAFSLRHNVFYARYFSFVFPPFAILSAFGIHAIATRFPGGARRAIILAWALILLLVSGLALQEAYANPRFDPFNWRRVAGLITVEAGPTDIIAVTPAFGTFPFLRYFHGSQQVVPMGPYEFNNPAGIANFPKDQAPEAAARALFQSYTADHEVLWLVTTVPLTRSAFVRLSSVFKGIYDLKMTEDFKGITVFKLVRHSP